jgi:hypothetical protein
MKSRKLLGVTALFYTNKKYLREWDRLWGLPPRPSWPAEFHYQNQPIDLSRSIMLPADSIH